MTVAAFVLATLLCVSGRWVLPSILCIPLPPFVTPSYQMVVVVVVVNVLELLVRGGEIVSCHVCVCVLCVCARARVCACVPCVRACVCVCV